MIDVWSSLTNHRCLVIVDIDRGRFVLTALLPDFYVTLSTGTRALFIALCAYFSAIVLFTNVNSPARLSSYIVKLYHHISIKIMQSTIQSLTLTLIILSGVSVHVGIRLTSVRATIIYFVLILIGPGPRTLASRINTIQKFFFIYKLSFSICRRAQ